MGREIKRVALDFEWPLGKVWEGFLNPYYKYAHKCKVCDGTGYSPRAKELSDMWYGYVPFDPKSTRSEPFETTHPAIRKLAARNVVGFDVQDGDYENTLSLLIDKESQRLCMHFNSHWCYHLSQEDVDALWEANRLTHDFKEKPTAKQVNEWTIGSMGHDCINQWICVKARCKKEKKSNQCSHCKGNGTIWESKEYKAKANRWKPKEPPKGIAYQVWETVSEGSPISPAFTKPEDLAKWMVDNDTSITSDTTFEQWFSFISGVQWAPSLVSMPGKGLVSGVQAITEQKEK